jgi:hypothetical protein
MIGMMNMLLHDRYAFQILNVIFSEYNDLSWSKPQ